MKRKRNSIQILIVFTLFVGISHSKPWEDATATLGLAGHQVSRVKFADLNNDLAADVVLMPDRKESTPPIVYLSSNEISLKFTQKTDTELPPLQRYDLLVFADLDNDGVQDAIITRYLDIYQDDYERPSEGPQRTSWARGRGDGAFDQSVILKEASLATTAAIAINDVNEDGQLDIFIGNWYERYFTGYEGFSNDLLLQYSDTDNQIAFTRWSIPNETVPTDFQTDLGGRPTYGVALPRLDEGLPMLLELNYGRRWNRLYKLNTREPIRKPSDSRKPSEPFSLKDPTGRGSDLKRMLRGTNIADAAGVDGDAIRHGRHPTWPEDLVGRNPRVSRPDEPPFRANGNTFDAAVGDIDNDGDFDLFLSTIIHAWAGESSDRSRFLVNQLQETGQLRFETFEYLSIDRLPAPPKAGESLTALHTNQNQGDIYAELADLNHDGLLDLVLCSSDYPDPPPYEERLRIFFQTTDNRFKDVTQELGIDHIGAGMPSLADVDQDGDLDILVGQSFNRLPTAMRRQAAITSGALSPESPEESRPERRARLFLNPSSEKRSSLVLYLEGDTVEGVSRDALGTIVKATVDLDEDPETPDVVQQRQLLGPSGHAGKQHAFCIHFGLGDASQATRLEIHWPGVNPTPTVFEELKAGRYVIKQGESNPRILP